MKVSDHAGMNVFEAEERNVWVRLRCFSTSPTREIRGPGKRVSKQSKKRRHVDNKLQADLRLNRLDAICVQRQAMQKV